MCLCMGGGGKIPSTPTATLEGMNHLKLMNTLVWSKGKTDGSFIGLGWRYRPSYENVIIFYKGKEPSWEGKPKSNVFVCKTVPAIDHPTPKPIKLMQFLILNHTKEGDIVFDPFMGSGTTCLAAKMLKRRYIGCELDLGYYLKAEKRINSWDGQTTL